MSGTRAISTTSRRLLSSSSFLFFLQGKAPKEIPVILTETLPCFLPGPAKDLSARLYILRLLQWSSVLYKGSNNKVPKLHTQEQYTWTAENCVLFSCRIMSLTATYFLRLYKIYHKQSSEAFRNTAFELGSYIFLMPSTPWNVLTMRSEFILAKTVICFEIRRVKWVADFHHSPCGDRGQE